MRRIEIKPACVCYVLLLFYLLPARILAAFFLAASTHELAHIAVIRVCRCRIERLIFGVADVQIVHGMVSLREKMLCAFAGPVVNLLFGGMFLRTASEFAAASLLLGGFNLLPICPLDGGQILRTGLQMCLPLERADKITESIGYFCCALVLAAAVFAVCYLRMGFWPLLPALVLPIRLWMMEKAVAFPPNRG